MEEISLKSYVNENLNRNNINLVALDEVTDPRNIGSIIRSATSFNIDGIIVKERSYPSESKLLYKSASGCTEMIKYISSIKYKHNAQIPKIKNFWVSGFDSKSKKRFHQT